MLERVSISTPMCSLYCECNISYPHRCKRHINDNIDQSQVIKEIDTTIVNGRVDRKDSLMKSDQLLENLSDFIRE